MNFQENEKEKVAFATLKNGECFKMKGTYFLKTKEIFVTDNANYRYANCVNLENGEYRYCSEEYVYNPIVNVTVIE